MLCIDCKIKQTRYPKGKRCNNCQTKFWRVNNPEQAKVITKKTHEKCRYGGNWIKALRRDNYTCQICFSKNKVEIHHKDGKGSTLPINQQNNQLENLITVCKKCHGHLEKGVRGPEKLKRFSRKFTCCVECKRSSSPHVSKGLCSRCYQQRRLEYKRIKQAMYVKKWALQKLLI